MKLKKDAKTFFESGLCDTALNTVLSKITIKEAVNRYMGYTGPDFEDDDKFGNGEDTYMFTLDEYENSNVFDFRDTISDNDADTLALFFSEVRMALSHVKFFFIGYSVALEEEINKYEPELSESGVEAKIKDMAAEKIRELYPSAITDEDFDKLYDVSWINDRLKTMHNIIDRIGR